MTRLRFTLAQLMGIVVILGFGFAALRNADKFWASLTYTIVFLVISVAPLVALARNGRVRMAWAGCAVFGWSRLLIGCMPAFSSDIYGQVKAPSLLSEQALIHLLSYLSSSRGISSDHIQILSYLEIILLGLVGAIIGRLIAPKQERPNH